MSTFADTLRRLSAALLEQGYKTRVSIPTDDLSDLLTEFQRSDRIARAGMMHTAEGMQRHPLRERFEAFFRTHPSAEGIEPDSSAHAIGSDGKYTWAHKQDMWDAYQAAITPVTLPDDKGNHEQTI